jgi:peptidoglycan/LPS O-acetylase OafA/YrhL
MMGLLTEGTGVFARALGYSIEVGWIGVQLFFVLSGFLITGILLDTQRAENYLSGFYARRLLRIFPLYYGVLCFAFLVLPLFGPLPATLQHDRAHQLWLWTYLSNWTSPYPAGSRAFPHFWSLAVEEQFYLVWPFLMRRRTPRECVQLSLLLAVASLAARVVMLLAKMPTGAIYTFTITRMDALVLGAAAAGAVRIPGLVTARMQPRLWLGALVVGIVGAFISSGYSIESAGGASIGYSFLAVSFTLLVLAAARADALPSGRAYGLRSQPLRILGKYSYGMYVFQKPLHDFVGKPLLRHFQLDASHSVPVAAIYIISGILVTLAAAFCSYQLFERRFLKLKNRFVPLRIEKEIAI